MSKKHKSIKPEPFEKRLFIGMAVGLLLLISAAVYFGSHVRPPKPTQASPGPVPVYYSRPEDAMPFAVTLDPVGFQRRDFRGAYQVAKDIPGVLAQQPCYCYCQREGHRSLLDCFTTVHATKCSICVKEALLAGQMHGQGKSAEEIRTAIIQGQWRNVKEF